MTMPEMPITNILTATCGWDK